MTKDIYDNIRKFNNDSDVIKLRNYYDSLSFMEILEVERTEVVHSSFLKWLLDPSHNYDLKTKPLMLLLDLLIKDENDLISVEDRKNITLRKVSIEKTYIQNEFPLKPKQIGGRLDLYITFNVNNNQYAIILENKVDSSENKESPEKGEWQTEKYYKYFEKQSQEHAKVNYIYVFLAPKYGEEIVKAHCEKYINISYDDIVNYIILPLLADDNLLDKTRFILEDYLKVLSKPNGKARRMISFDVDEKENDLINKINSKHEDLYNLLNTDKEDEILKEFLEDELNRLVISAVWPSIMSKRNRNKTVTFEELGLEKGTILYLATGDRSGTRMQDEYGNNIEVQTVDNKTTVMYNKGGKEIICKLSPAAQDLSGKFPCRGINWFIYNKDGVDYNLYTYYYEVIKNESE